MVNTLMENKDGITSVSSDESCASFHDHVLAWLLLETRHQCERDNEDRHGLAISQQTLMLAHGDVKFANQAIPAFVAQDQTMDFLHHEYEGMESLSSDSSYSDASECSEQRQRQDTNTTDDAVSKVDDALLTFITLARTPLTAISCLLTSTFEHPRSSLEATAATTPVHISDGAASLGKWAELKQDDRVSSSEEPMITTAVTAAPTHDAENVEEEAASQPASYAPDSEWRCIDSWGLTEGEAQDIYELLAAKMQFSVNAGSPMRRRIVPHEPGQMSPIV